MKTLKKNNISQGSAINSPVPVNKNCDLPPFFNTDYFSHVVVQTLEELESIPCKLRQDGMVATVVQDGYSDYQLQTSRTGFGICDNNAWVKISIGDEVFNGGNLFLFQTEEQANEFMGSTQSKEGQIIYISDLDSYFKFDGQDGLTDAFPNKLDKPTVQGLDNPNYKIPAYLDGKPYWRSSSDFEKVKSVNSKTGDVVLKTSDLQNDSDYTTNSELNKEVQDRIAQINDVEQKLQIEESERISEDDILNYKIDTTKTELNTNFDAKLSQESTLRQNQDAVLDNKITTEKTDRINADNLKLDKPTTTGSTISHPNVVGVDSQGNSAKLPAGDLGKNFANTDLTVSVNRKHTGTASVELATPMIYSNPSQRFSGLIDKSSDATYNVFPVLDSNGNLGKADNAINALTKTMQNASDAQKDAWRTASLKTSEGYSHSQPTVTTIMPNILIGLDSDFVQLQGTNLFLNPNYNGAYIEVIDTSTNQVVETIYDFVTQQKDKNRLSFRITRNLYQEEINYTVKVYNEPLFSIVNTSKFFQVINKNEPNDIRINWRILTNRYNGEGQKTFSHTINNNDVSITNYVRKNAEDANESGPVLALSQKEFTLQENMIIHCRFETISSSVAGLGSYNGFFGFVPTTTIPFEGSTIPNLNYGFLIRGGYAQYRGEVETRDFLNVLIGNNVEFYLFLQGNEIAMLVENRIISTTLPISPSGKYYMFLNNNTPSDYMQKTFRLSIVNTY